jgi:hypothetical protein
MLHLWYLDAVTAGIDVFDDAIGQSGSHWALLFDELELAPTWIREELFASMRSVDDRVIFKLSISPYDEHIRTANIFGPMPGDDYDAIPLWYARREDSFDFCSELWESMLRDRGYLSETAVSTLGASVFDPDDEASGGYGPKSGHRRRFRQLAKDDATFAEYLAARDLDASALDIGTEEKRAAEVRKIISLVAVRHAYRVPDHSASRQTIRSRKNPKLYVGARSVFAMVEANPRWLRAIGNRLLDSADGRGRVPAAVQNREVTNAAKRFVAMLQAIPCSLPEDSNKDASVASVIEDIGQFFFRCAVRDDFNADPPGSFVVDADTPQFIADSLGKALNVGALVYLPEDEARVIMGGIVGKRFRLCYLLAALYRFPLRLGRSVTLSHILSEMRAGRGSIAPDARDKQRTLL